MTPVISPGVGDTICAWLEGSRRFTIHLDRDVAARLSARCWTTLKSLPRHKPDADGFLLGREESRLSESGEPTVDIWITGLQPKNSIPADAERRSDIDHRIGVYRAQKNEHAPTSTDVKLCDQCSEAGEPLLIAVGPSVGTASLYRPTGGELRHVLTFSLPSFFSTNRNGSKRTRAELRGTVIAPSRRRFGSRFGITFAMVSVSLLTIALPAVMRSRYIARGIGPQNLNLNIAGNGPAFRITWDREATALRTAQRGTLYIRDADRQTFQEISATQLKTGSVNYQATSAEPSFRLEVYSSAPSAVGAVQVVKMPPPRPIELIARRRSEMPAVMVKSPVHRATPTGAGDPRSTLGQTAPASSPTLPIASGSIGEQSSRGPHMEMPVAVDQLAGLPLRATQVAPISAKSNEEPYVEVLPETISGSRWEQIAGSRSVLRKFTKQEITAPVATYEANPLVQLEGRRVTQSVFVDVKLNISVAGRVLFAEITKYGDPPDLRLANAALAAAKTWIFKPALMQNSPVASEMVLHFHFVP